MTPTAVETLVVGRPEAAESTAERLAAAADRIDPTPVGPAAAVERVEAGRADCVVASQDLPETTGTSLLREVRDLDPSMPFFLLAEDDAARRAAVEAGATDARRPDGEDSSLANNVVNAGVRRAAEGTGDRGPTREGGDGGDDPADDVEGRYRQLLGSSPLPVLILDGDAEVVFTNAAADRLLAGGDPEAIPGRPLSAFVDDGDWPALEGSVESAAHHGTTGTEAEVRVEATDGTRKYVKAAVAPGRYRGEPSAQVVLSEVTDYKQFNDDLRELHTIAARRDDDFERKVEDVLRLGCERLGLRIGFLSAIDRTFEVLAARGDHPKIQPGAESPLSKTYCRKAIELDTPLAVEDAPEEGWSDDPAYEAYDLRCYLGAKVIVEGDLYGTLCFADAERSVEFDDADVTVVDLMAQWVGYEIERNRHVAELRDQNERFEELAGALSHDLGNLLELARGHVEFALETGDLDRLEEAHDAHDRAGTLLEHMVSLTRAGQQIDDREEVYLRVVATEAWTHVERAGGDLEIEIDDESAVVADRSRLLQLFENLFRNAMDHGGEAVTVRVGTTGDGFFVADDGVGIPEGDRDAVFETGYSTGEDGTGLGLSIVNRVVTAHDWSIDVAESVDGGARFDVTDVTWADPR